MLIEKEIDREIKIFILSDDVTLEGNLFIPLNATGVVLFAHGTGSGRFSPRNRMVAKELNSAGFATLLFDLLTRREEASEEVGGHLRFDIDLLSRRLRGAATWVSSVPELMGFPLGYFGASTGAAAALTAAAAEPLGGSSRRSFRAEEGPTWRSLFCRKLPSPPYSSSEGAMTWLWTSISRHSKG